MRGFIMNSLLEKAIKEVSKLPEKEQNALAKWILEEIKSDKMWREKFANSEDVLFKLANEALCEENEGKTSNLDINKL